MSTGQAKLPEHATRTDWYMALAMRCATACSPTTSRRVNSITGPRASKVVAYLSAEFLTGPHLGQQPREPRDLGRGAEGGGQRRPGSRDAARARRGARARQRRARTPGGLLHGLAGDAASSGDRLRHPLRVRHLRSGDPRRLAGRTDRQVASLRQPVGDRRVRRSSYEVQFGGRTAGYTDERGHYRVRWMPDRVVKGVAYDTPVPGYGVPTTQPVAAVEGGSDRVVRLRRVQPRRLLRRGATKNRLAKPSPRSSIRTTNPKPASGCDSSSSTSSSPARCRT